MAINRVGGVQFDCLEMTATPPGEEAEDITRYGSDGRAFRKAGKRGESIRLLGKLHVVDVASRVTLINSCLALRGTIVAVDDRWQYAWLNMIVREVRELRSFPIKCSVGSILGSAATIQTEIEFEVVDARRST